MLSLPDIRVSLLKVTVFLLVVEGLFTFFQYTVFSLSFLPNWSHSVGYFLGDLTSAFCVFVALRLMKALDAESPAIVLNLRQRGWASELALGLCIGAVLSAGYILLLMAFGWYRITGHGAHFNLAFSIFANLVVAVWEETCYRGYIFRVVEPKCGSLAALLLSSMLFGAGHVLYHVHDYTLAGAIARTFTFTIAGLFYGAAYLVSHRLWLPIGIHWVMNVIVSMFIPGKYADNETYFLAMVSHNQAAWVSIVLDALIAILLVAIGVRLGRWHSPSQREAVVHRQTV